MSSVVLPSPVRPRLRNRRRRTAIASAAAGYAAAYTAGVLGLFSFFFPTGRAAVLALAAAVAFATLTVAMLALDKRLRPREAPRLRRRLA